MGHLHESSAPLCATHAESNEHSIDASESWAPDLVEWLYDEYEHTLSDASCLPQLASAPALGDRDVSGTVDFPPYHRIHDGPEATDDVHDADSSAPDLVDALFDEYFHDLIVDNPSYHRIHDSPEARDAAHEADSSAPVIVDALHFAAGCRAHPL